MTLIELLFLDGLFGTGNRRFIRAATQDCTVPLTSMVQACGALTSQCSQCNSGTRSGTTLQSGR